MKSLKDNILEKLIINQNIGRQKIVVNNKSEIKNIIEEIIEETNNEDSINLNHVDVSNITDITRLFRSYRFKHIDISKWNVSNIVNMQYVFPETLETINLSNWDVSNVQLTVGMFYNCKNLKEIGDISNWNIKSLKNASDMFNSCSSIKTIDISNWDLSSLDSANRMFYNCRELESIGNITKQQLIDSSKYGRNDMFLYCTKLKK